MAKPIIKHWDADLVDCPSATVPTLAATVKGGESITLKSESAANGYHLVGSRNDIIQGRGYKLWGGEVMTITLNPEFGMSNALEIWALPSAAGADLTYFKVSGSTVEGIVAIELMKKALAFT